MTRKFPFVALGLVAALVPALFQPGPLIFSTAQTTSTSENSLLVGCALGSVSCTGGIKAGKISLAAGLALSGATISDAGVVIPSAVPSATTNALYNDAGVLKWNGAALATGSSISGTTNAIPVFTSATSLGNSIIAQDAGATIATVTGTLNATVAFQLNGTSINTAGTLSNVAYKNQNNSFTVSQTIAAGLGLSNGTPSTHGLMLPNGTPADTTTNLYNASSILTWPGGLSLSTAADSALVTLALRGGGAAGAYTVSNSGFIFKDSAGTELWRIWGSDPNGANFNAGNLYIGQEAGLAQPTDNVSAGTDNIGIGTDVLRSITQGDDNLGVGTNTLTALTTGNANVGYGSNVLVDMVTGSNNTAIGDQALTNATGSNGVAVGSGALLNLVAGNQNTAIGTDAGRFYTGAVVLAAPIQSVFVGASTRASGNANTNEIVIGYNADGHGTNTATLGSTSVTQAYLPAAIFQGTRTVALGEWADHAFSAGDYTASSGTWTVAAGDVTLSRFTIVGKTVTWQVTLVTTDVSATPTELRVAIPGSLTTSAHVRGGSCGATIDAGTNVQPAIWRLASGGTYVALAPNIGSGNWATATANTAVSCTIVFEIA